MVSIVVTIPKDKIKAVEAEEAIVAQRLANGEKDILYYWQMGSLPSKFPMRIYFCWDGAVQAWHEVVAVRDGRVYMKPEIHSLEQLIPMQSFRGFRYFEEKE